MSSPVQIEPERPFVVPEAVVPLRGQPAESAEMVSQLLFGEHGTILATAGTWCQVRRAFDGYEGWVDAKMIEPVAATAENLGQGPFVIEGSLVFPDGSHLRLPAGVRLPGQVSPSTPNFLIGPRAFSISSSIQLTHIRTKASVVATTGLFFHTPYLWGGVSSFGLDCSGLVQTVFRMCGVNLPRDASQQIAYGDEVPFAQRQAGDLAYFSNINRDRVSHVGILSDHDHILHASGRVRRDAFSAQGIVHSASGHLTHQLISIRRC